MLRDLFPKGHARYSSLPLLGAIADDFAAWLLQRGHKRSSARYNLRVLVYIDRHLRRRGFRELSKIPRAALETCSATLSRHRYDRGCIVHTLVRFLEACNFLPPAVPDPPNRTTSQVGDYAEYLKDVRGLERSTIFQHLRTASEFLHHVSYDTDPSRLAQITRADVESYVRICGKRHDRGSLQHVVSQLRSFLRFLASQRAAPPGLDTQIDTPRLYRLEQLPRSLPWRTVQAFLRSIDRTTPLGLRDYTIFFLIATYGLRASEIVALTLDDIHWRSSQIQLPQKKTGAPVFLPLTDEAGVVLLRYLRRSRPSLPYRELFLRARAPHGVLKPTAVTEAFQAWSRRSGLEIPFHGAHCLRHSYAVHLLRQGISLKTIGDLLGHRNAESTCVYLRLATEDLRDVALSLPRHCSEPRAWEVRS